VRQLSITEGELAGLETIVRSGLQSFMSVGLALIEIRQTKGYQLRGFDTFEVYCQQTFNFTARHGRRMMVAAKTADQVAGVMGEAPANELVARVLAPIAGDAQALQSIKTRLDARGLKLSQASGGMIVALMRGGVRVHLRPHDRARTTPLSRIAGHDRAPDVCPNCGERPMRYFYRQQEGGWLCSHCSRPVKLSVS